MFANIMIGSNSGILDMSDCRGNIFHLLERYIKL